MKRFLLCSVLCTAAVLYSCRTQSAVSIPPDNIQNISEYIREGITPEHWSWKSVCSGIRYIYFQNTELPIRWHMIRIELSTPNLHIISYPQKNQIADDGSFTGLTVKRFSDIEDVCVAVNASPFNYVGGRFGSRRKITGLYICNGEQLSPPLEKYAALLFTRKDNRLSADILAKQTEPLPEHTIYAFGGFYEILKDGVIQEFRHHSFDSRTAAGISQDGSELYLFCAEGEWKPSSAGLTYEECAYILSEAGASDALQLDGGGSAAISVSGMDTMGYPVFRRSANIFGFTAAFQQNSD